MAIQHDGASGYAVACQLRLRAPTGLMVALLRDDPFEWLPAPVLQHGVHQFRCTLRLWGMRTAAVCTLTGPWVRGAQTARGVRLVVVESLLAELVGELRGQVSVKAADGGGARLMFEGHWAPTGGRLAAPLRTYVERRLARAFLRGVGVRMRSLADVVRTDG